MFLARLEKRTTDRRAWPLDPIERTVTSDSFSGVVVQWRSMITGIPSCVPWGHLVALFTHYVTPSGMILSITAFVSLPCWAVGIENVLLSMLKSPIVCTSAPENNALLHCSMKMFHRQSCCSGDSATLSCCFMY